MKHNTQVLSFQNIEPIIEDRQVMVNYTVEGEPKHLMIPFEHLSSFLTQHRVKVAGYNDNMGIEELDILWWSEATICETVEAFIRNYERFDLIVENRKLRDKVERMESAFKFAEVGKRIMKDFRDSADKVIGESNWIDARLPRYNRCLGESAVSKHAIEILNDIIRMGGVI